MAKQYENTEAIDAEVVSVADGLDQDDSHIVLVTVRHPDLSTKTLILKESNAIRALGDLHKVLVRSGAPARHQR